jgi:shikimate kinase
VTERRIVITGFMGSGKTTIATALAHKLHCEAVDLDQIISANEGLSPKQIITLRGEKAFRVVESRNLAALLQSGAARIIALGGGAWTIAENRREIAKYGCFSIWLDLPFQMCWRRIIEAAHERPLAPDKDTAQRLYEDRKRFYKLADLRIVIKKETKLSHVILKIVAALNDPLDC